MIGSTRRVSVYAFGAPVDIVVFGDTHFLTIEEHQGVLFVNPGSPTLPQQMQRLGTVAVLELGPGTRRAGSSSGATSSTSIPWGRRTNAPPRAVSGAGSASASA